ncbi:DUF3392 family protein [Pseudoalteromonas sp. Hal040]|uniref:DUF3392 family protein n=1 Tax=unclassified Pseudoalteromonas TaxID=194690 RepID=UPI00301E3348
MDSLLQALSSVALTIGNWLQPHLYNISLLLVVCFISLYANDIIKVTKRFVARRHFVVRVLCFVLITGFGMGLLVVFVTPFLSKLLMLLGVKWLALTLTVAFLVLGIIADKKNQI